LAKIVREADSVNVKIRLPIIYYIIGSFMRNFTKSWARSIVLALASLLIFCFPASADENPPDALPDLFSVPEPEVLARSNELERFVPDPAHPEVIRSRTAEVDFILLENMARAFSRLDGPAFSLNLFDDSQFAVTLTRTEQFPSGALGLVGTVDSEEYNELVMVSHNGAMQAYLQVGRKIYEIRYSAEGHQIVEVNQSAYPESLPPLIPPQSDQSATTAAPSDGDAIPALDTGAEIDVLAVYTPAARVYLGSALAVENRIQTSILSANEGYQNSGVNQRLNLVGMEEVAYDETANIVPDTGSGETWDTAAWYYALDRLTDGRYRDDTITYLEDARAYRELYGADLVFMVTDLPFIYCGLGWVAGDAGDDEYGFSVVQVNCTGAGEFTPQHEMGHNMGACHDWANTSSSIEPYCWDDYSHGYQQPNQFYTVMAYYAGCGDCDRINRWSNPNLDYGGYSTGVPLDQAYPSYNALTLNNTAYNVANWRQSVSAISGNFTNPTPGGQVSSPRDYVQFTAASSEGSVTSVAFHAEYDGSWHLIETDSDGSDGWEILWENVGIPEQIITIKAVVTDSAANTREFVRNNILLSASLTSIHGYKSKSGGGEEAVGGGEAITPLEQQREDETAAVLEQRAENPPPVQEVLEPLLLTWQPRYNQISRIHLY
jgi:hypothetical protein